MGCYPSPWTAWPVLAFVKAPHLLLGPVTHFDFSHFSSVWPRSLALAKHWIGEMLTDSVAPNVNPLRSKPLDTVDSANRQHDAAMKNGGVLYHNPTYSVNLLDIPKSIEDAQGGDSSSNRHLLSSRPVDQPFKSLEPKTIRGKQKLTETQGELHQEYASAIQLALDEIHEQHAGHWCLHRHVALSQKGRKRTAEEAGLKSPVRQELGTVGEAGATSNEIKGSKHGDDGAPNLPEETHTAVKPFGDSSTELSDAFFKTLSACQDDADAHHRTVAYRHISTVLSTADDQERTEPAIDDVQLPVGTFIQNSSDRLLQAEISTDASHSFFIPPLSRAVLADCNESASLRIALRGAFLPNASPIVGKHVFDLIVLDPPWPNRSAKRKGSYEVQYSLRDTESLLYGMDLDIHLAPGGYVAIWITNRVAVRDLTLGRSGHGEGGWFESLGVELIEEWIWIKTTMFGEPVSVLGGVWRKPYEVLLVGRQSSESAQPAADCQPRHVRRRIIAAVPDLHSRKPCLKALFEELLFRGRQYQALEVFARYMVSGWWSWGNEAIKFNWNGHWTLP